MVNLEAIQWKYGDIEGLSERGGVITKWAYNFPLPSVAELDAVMVEYNNYMAVQKAHESLQVIRNANRDSGIVHNTVRLYSDKASTNDIAGKVLSAVMSDKTNTDVISSVWKGMDGVLLNPTLLDFKLIGELLATLIGNAYTAENTVVGIIDKASPSQLKALDIQAAFDTALSEI